MIISPNSYVSSALSGAACTASAQWTWANITAATISPRTVQLWGMITAIAVPNKMEGS